MAERKAASGGDGPDKPRRRAPRAAAKSDPAAPKTPTAGTKRGPRGASAAKKPAAQAASTAAPASRRGSASAKPAAKRVSARPKRQPLVSEQGTEAVVEQLTSAETIERGLAARAKVPIEALGMWAPSAKRPSPISLLQEQEADRVQWLVPLRHGRMAVSPFTFYRGAAKVMAYDLSTSASTGLVAQICGDAHLANFGLYGTPERRLVFDVNDFDETLPGPVDWDVKRLVASMVIATRDRGFKKRDQKAAARQAATSYRTAMIEFAKSPALQVFYSSISDQDILELLRVNDPKAVKRGTKTLEKARSRTSLQVFSRLTEVVDGKRRIKTVAPTIYNWVDIPPGTTALESIDAADQILRSYRRTLSADRRRLLERYRLVDVAIKVVGVGSVGTRCFIVLLEGMDEGDPLFLQVKQAEASVLEPHLHRSRYKNHGERVVSGQRLMQAASDIFLGWITAPMEWDFYWRQLKDWKGGLDFARMTPEIAVLYGGVCGWTLARAHARSGDPLEIASYLGGTEEFEDAMVNFALAYADQNELDYAEFMEGVKSGDIQTEKG